MPVKKAAKPLIDPVFKAALLAAGLPLPVPEYRFHAERRWRLDWAWPEYQVALETEGAVWTQGRHTRGSGFVKDMEKYNELSAMGWSLVRVQPSWLATDYTIELLVRIIGRNRG